MVATPIGSTAGSLLREWRQRRRMSQLELATEAGISARHLSFVETGRARPSREMVLHLAEQLDVPLRDRNGLLLAAGFAPLYPERPLADEEMSPVRDALDRLLTAHDPYPAVVVDGHWNLVAANEGLGFLTAGVAPELLEPPANTMRIAVHPDGMAPHVVNFAEWSGHLMHRLRRRAAITDDQELERLHAELAALPGVSLDAVHTGIESELVLPLRMRHDDGELTFISTQTTFGTAVDITLAELSIECFYPADARTADALRI
jgi:transcriptional regulator with XRE-family HTH domain